MSGKKHKEAPTSTVLLAALRRHPAGLTALSLADSVMQQGYSGSEVQRAIRRAIDGGTVIIGKDLELRPRTAT